MRSAGSLAVCSFLFLRLGEREERKEERGERRIFCEVPLGNGTQGIAYLRKFDLSSKSKVKEKAKQPQQPSLTIPRLQSGYNLLLVATKDGCHRTKERCFAPISASASCISDSIFMAGCVIFLIRFSKSLFHLHKTDDANPCT